ncbi:MAG: DUF4236 domain-containing protein [Mesorhizobium sp.]|uniref:DUF4236 domain-containing protein n=1 Tax=Mesorhizobium sp. TaxID=1871066 RepID=UPI0011F97FC9|nr:DUF4236 domain-containing protein [Mesorhizobium sp.]TIL95151.1 MAG: DUF4236 domain-containing protein [Mesorhizobium sp.]
MVLRFRKSIRIAPGVRINLNAKNASVRVGPKSLGYTVSTTGKKRLSASILGTGLSYSEVVSSKRRPVPSAPSQLTASQTKPSGKRPLAFVLLAIGAGLVWCSTPYNDTKIAGERLSTARSSEQQNLTPATAEPDPRVSRPASSVQKTLYSTANVRLRTSPSAESQIVLTVPVGSAVLSSRREGSWHHVSYGNYSGWILGNYLAELRPEPEATSSPIAPVVSREQPANDSNTISGRATIIDGDTIDIAGTRVRFNGIDAPESTQLCQNAKNKNYRCGQSAAKALDAWLATSRPVTCKFVEWDHYGRFVGDCYRSDGAAVATWLVSAGHAMDWPLHSGGVYASYQDEARMAKRGIWQGEFQPAWEWRAAQQAAPKPETTSPVRLLSGSCDIKGNISNKGVRIYHLPGQRFYDKTVLSPAKGERMFCSEDEARAAGWRRSKR